MACLSAQTTVSFFISTSGHPKDAPSDHPQAISDAMGRIQVTRASTPLCTIVEDTQEGDFLDDSGINLIVRDDDALYPIRPVSSSFIAVQDDGGFSPSALPSWDESRNPSDGSGIIDQVCSASGRPVIVSYSVHKAVVDLSDSHRADSVYDSGYVLNYYRVSDCTTLLLHTVLTSLQVNNRTDVDIRLFGVYGCHNIKR
jgi:hypothetical protein